MVEALEWKGKIMSKSKVLRRALSVTLIPSMVLISVVATLVFVEPKPLVMAAQPTSANLAYVTADYRAYCEVPTGNMVYVAKVSPGAGGAAITVVPGGCK